MGQEDSRQQGRSEELPAHAQPEGPTSGEVADTAGPADQHQVERTRTSTLWTSVAVAAVVLLLLLIFILQNIQDVKVSYLWMSGRLPLGVALLFAAVGGALLVVLLGVARIVQLRRVARRNRRSERRGEPDGGTTAT